MCVRCDGNVTVVVAVVVESVEGVLVLLWLLLLSPLHFYDNNRRHVQV